MPDARKPQPVRNPEAGPQILVMKKRVTFLQQQVLIVGAALGSVRARVGAEGCR